MGLKVTLMTAKSDPEVKDQVEQETGEIKKKKRERVDPEESSEPLKGDLEKCVDNETRYVAIDEKAKANPEPSRLLAINDNFNRFKRPNRLPIKKKREVALIGWCSSSILLCVNQSTKIEMKSQIALIRLKWQVFCSVRLKRVTAC
jgi:hypothetical protein